MKNSKKKLKNLQNNKINNTLIFIINLFIEFI